MIEKPISDIKKPEDGRQTGRPHKDDSERAVRISITLPPDALKIADRHATAGNISRSEFIGRTISYYDVNCVEASPEVNATRNTTEYKAAAKLLGEKLEQMRMEFNVPIDKVTEDIAAQALKFRYKWKIQ
jgi:hypothetical protein